MQFRESAFGWERWEMKKQGKQIRAGGGKNLEGPKWDGGCEEGVAGVPEAWGRPWGSLVGSPQTGTSQKRRRRGDGVPGVSVWQFGSEAV